MLTFQCHNNAINIILHITLQWLWWNIILKFKLPNDTSFYALKASYGCLLYYIYIYINNWLYHDVSWWYDTVPNNLILLLLLPPHQNHSGCLSEAMMPTTAYTAATPDDKNHQLGSKPCWNLACDMWSLLSTMTGYCILSAKASVIRFISPSFNSHGNANNIK